MEKSASAANSAWEIARRTALLFDRPGTRWLLSALLPIAAWPLADGVRRIWHDRGWIHRFDDGVVVEPRPRLRSYDIGRRRNEYLWGFLYEPKSGDTVVDVGAGLGAETIFFSRQVGPSGRVFAIEAHPQICAYLERSVALNQLSQVQVLNVALSNRRGTVHIQDDLDDLLGNFLVDGQRGVPVEALSLDELTAREKIGRIDFLKMNIEGAERLAIEGLTNTLPKVAIVCISCHDFKYKRTNNQFFETKKFVRDFLIQNGFVVFDRENNQPEITDQLNAFNPSLLNDIKPRQM